MAFSYTFSNPSTIFNGHGAKYSVMDFNCARDRRGMENGGGNLERAFRNLHMHCHEFLN